jgi:hypothetical protein
MGQNPPEKQSEEKKNDHPYHDADQPGAFGRGQLMVWSNMGLGSAWLRYVSPVSNVVLHQWIWCPSFLLLRQMSVREG